VKLEDLRGLERKAVHTAYLRRWPRARLLRLALSCTPPWTGVALVNPRATSSVCPICGGRLRRKGYRKLVCAECGRSWHRDEAAAVNIALAEISELVRIPDEPGAARGGGERMKGEMADRAPQRDEAGLRRTSRPQYSLWRWTLMEASALKLPGRL